MGFVFPWQSIDFPVTHRLATIMVLLILQGSPCMTKAIDSPRWENPCSGTSASRTGVPMTAPLGIVPVNQQHHAISQQAFDARLQYIQPLLSNYEARFGMDQTTMRDVTSQMEAQLFGTSHPNFTSSSASDRLGTLLKGYNDLAHLAVFMEQVVADQEQLQTEKLEHMVLIDELGVYWILCAMKRLTAELGETTQTQHSRATMPEQYRQVNSQATQQVRDYTVLKSLQMLLERIEKENRRLASGSPVRRHRRHSNHFEKAPSQY